LINDSVNVSVTDTAIDLNGTVGSGKEKITAKRIAQSYAGNRKVTDHLTISARSNTGTTTPDNSNNPPGNMGTTSPSSTSPSSTSPSSTTNPEGNKTNPPAGTPPPKR
jgi:hypothetical protein